MRKDLEIIIASRFPGFNIDSAYEYKSIIVFNIVPKTGIEDGAVIEDSSFSVNKKTKEIKVFSPFDLSLEEYQNGRKIM